MGAGVVAGKVTKAADQTISNDSSPEQIGWDTEDYDYGSIHAAGTLTPTVTGIYRIHGQIVFDADDGGTHRTVSLYEIITSKMTNIDGGCHPCATLRHYSGL